LWEIGDALGDVDQRQNRGVYYKPQFDSQVPGLDNMPEKESHGSDEVHKWQDQGESQFPQGWWPS
jgi:hypothetical protein